MHLILAQVVANTIFPWTKRLRRSVFSDYAHFPLFLWVFQCTLKYPSKRPTSKLHHPYFFSDILVVSHFVSCVPSACGKRQQWRL